MVPHGRLVRQILLAGMAASLMTASLMAPGGSTAHARWRDGLSLPSIETALDAFFEATFPVQATMPPAIRPTLDDGRSSVSERWRYSLENFAISDAERFPAQGGVVIAGSSSVSAWHALEAQFPSQTIVRRGLGGARMSDCVHYVDRLVLPYRPRLVIVYAGDNDLAEGVSPEAILASFIELVRQVRHALPNTRVAFVSVKPSPARVALMALARRTNTLIAAYAETDSRLDFIDVFTPMLAADGQPRRDLFEPDALHLSAAGYELWRQALAPHLE